MHLDTFKKVINIFNVDTKENDLDIEKWTANENDIYGYVCKDKKGNVIGTKFFMEHVKIPVVVSSFRKIIRDNRIQLV
ncbi:MAG: hypothetical protein FWC41_03235 [Firmicutes bacterium]|nr:hypothetical protein [Bacillota bacterium]